MGIPSPFYLHLRITQLSEEECSNNFTNSMPHKDIRLIKSFIANPILIGNGCAFVPSFVVIVAMNTSWKHPNFTNFRELKCFHEYKHCCEVSKTNRRRGLQLHKPKVAKVAGYLNPNPQVAKNIFSTRVTAVFHRFRLVQTSHSTKNISNYSVSKHWANLRKLKMKGQVYSTWFQVYLKVAIIYLTILWLSGKFRARTEIPNLFWQALR